MSEQAPVQFGLGIGNKSVSVIHEVIGRFNARSVHRLTWSYVATELNWIREIWRRERREHGRRDGAGGTR